MSDTKAKKAEKVPAAEKRAWYFPEDGVTIEAVTIEEAQAELAERKAGRA